MNKRRLGLRIAVSPMVLLLLIVTYIYGAFKRWLDFLKWGGEFSNYEKDDSVMMQTIYNELKQQRNETSI